MHDLSYIKACIIFDRIPRHEFIFIFISVFITSPGWRWLTGSALRVAIASANWLAWQLQPPGGAPVTRPTLKAQLPSSYYLLRIKSNLTTMVYDT